MAVLARWPLEPPELELELAQHLRRVRLVRVQLQREKVQRLLALAQPEPGAAQPQQGPERVVEEPLQQAQRLPEQAL